MFSSSPTDSKEQLALSNDMLRYICLFTSTVTDSNLARSSKQLYKAISATNHNLENHCAVISPAAKLGQMVMRGQQEEVKKILEAANGQTLSDLLCTRIKVTSRSGRIFNAVPVLFIALWGLDKHMWTMLIEFLDKIDSETVATQLREFMDAEQPKFVNDNGLHFNFNIINAHYNAYNTYKNGLVWDPSNVNSEEHLLLQELWCQVIEAMADLPQHVIQELCSPARKLKIAGDSALVNELNLNRTESLLDGTSVYDDHGEDVFGKTFGIVRLKDGAVKVNISEPYFIKRYEHDYNGTSISYTELNADTIRDIGEKRLSEFTALIQDRHLNTSILAPKKP